MSDRTRMRLEKIKDHYGQARVIQDVAYIPLDGLLPKDSLSDDSTLAVYEDGDKIAIQFIRHGESEEFKDYTEWVEHSDEPHLIERIQQCIDRVKREDSEFEDEMKELGV